MRMLFLRGKYTAFLVQFHQHNVQCPSVSCFCRSVHNNITGSLPVVLTAVVLTAWD